MCTLLSRRAWIYPRRDANMHTTKGKHTGRRAGTHAAQEGKAMTVATTTATATTARKPYTEVEALIEKEIEKESELYDLDIYDINDIRLEIYRANGWSYDPWPEGEEEEDEEDVFDPDEEPWFHRDPYYEYTERGLSFWDFV